MADFRMRGNDIWIAGHTSKSATVDEARRAIDGTGAMDNVTVAALWLIFVRKP